MLAMLGFAREGTDTAPPPDRRRSSVAFQTPREASTRHIGDGRGSKASTSSQMCLLSLYRLHEARVDTYLHLR